MFLSTSTSLANQLRNPTPNGDAQLPRGECAFILPAAEPGRVRQRCSCRSFYPTAVVRSQCGCGHQAWHHETQSPHTASADEYAQVVEEVKRLKHEVKRHEHLEHNLKQELFRERVAGVDIDWEYPGGNGEDYKTTPNSEKAWEIEAYPKLLTRIRDAIGPSKTLSAAVPGLPRDMLAFASSTVPDISMTVDFLNIMTYDMFNRRDDVTKHHTGLQLSAEAIDAYLERGLPSEKANLGLAFYTKWYKTDPSAKAECSIKPVGCPTALMEDPITGADLGKAGAFSWHDKVPSELSSSWSKAQANGVYDSQGGGHYYWDEEEDLFWSWDTEAAILKKFPEIVVKKELGGAFAWGLGEDAPQFTHLKATTEGILEWTGQSRTADDKVNGESEKSEL